MVVETSNRDAVRESVVSHRGRFQSDCGRKCINFNLGSTTTLLFT